MHPSTNNGTFVEGAVSPSSSSHSDSFAQLFKNLRKQLVGKQACLSGAGLRCTDAAISHWERGLRLPRAKTMRNAVNVLRALGATREDIDRLMSAWSAEHAGRRLMRSRLAPRPNEAA
jgi:transcriptional regulator with XRE-family HTH domain